MKISPIATVILFITTAAIIVSCRLCCQSTNNKLSFVGDQKCKKNSQTSKGLVVITHGWIEQAEDSWPQVMATAIQERVDTGKWTCAYFDWSRGAAAINPKNAAEHARDHTGPALAQHIIDLNGEFSHIHLIAHSSGCWAISEAAKIIAEKIKADIHLTFLDAYVPGSWHQSELGDIKTAPNKNYWADHYYTRDYTLESTQQNLQHAHNVDITAVDPGIKDHNFPRQWYHSTICGEYQPRGFTHRNLTSDAVADCEYGFSKSREAHKPEGWKKSLSLPMGNEAVKLRPVNK